MGTKEKLAALRKHMQQQQVAAYIQPVHDAYMSEYPPACYKRVEWLSGFSGSAGTLVITQEKAALFTDGRYTLQASNQLDSKLFACFNSGDKTPETWLTEQLSSGNIGYDGELFTPALVRRLQATLNTKNLKLQRVDNYVDAIWRDRPAVPATPIFLHEERYAGASSQEKCTKIAALIREKNADALFIVAPEALCWLLNIRARDTLCTALVLARAIIDAEAKVTLFVDAKRLPPLPDFITTAAPESLAAQLEKLRGKTLWVDDTQTSQAHVALCEQAGIQLLLAPDPINALKAVKNKTQLAAIKQAHIIDGAAITHLLHWLFTHPAIHSVSEIDIDEKLLALRSAHADFVEPSFPTIAGFAEHGAIVHYRANATSSRTLGFGELLLIDSGGQYKGGTTDITRTIAIGPANPEHKRHFTLVLKGHIALATARFPKGTRGSQLDTLARQFLWQDGLDYDHGTGHGVGQFLGVHEGPQRISKRGGDAVLEAGMILSNEPGYYKEGAYGIRIENLVVVVAKDDGFLGFDTITCAPIDTTLVDFSLLTETEKNWLNDYHRWVRETLATTLPAEVQAWLDAVVTSYGS